MISRNPTHGPFVLFLAILLLTIGMALTGITLAADPESQGGDQVAQPRSLVSLTEKEAAKLDPMNMKIRQVLLAEVAEVDRLTADLADVADDAEALAIQRRIGVVKQQAEIDVMEIQVTFAEEAGHDEQAEVLREAVAGMKEALSEALEYDGGRP